MELFVPWLVLIVATLNVIKSDSGDQVLSLPGLDTQLNFKHYSGYLKASGAKKLHYWFVESQLNPSTDPVILWLNGGPGCSSLEGMLNELGPFHMKSNDEIYTNPFSWNKFASVLFLEAPAGVGFSYSDDKNYTTDDDQVSMDNYLALKDFFSKFPAFKNNDFFVTGESYGGIYVPTLTVRILQGLDEFPLNLKGYAVGNGLSSYAINDNSLVFFAYYHGLIGDRLWDKLVASCCKNNTASRENCDFASGANSVCSAQVSKVSDIVYNEGLNVYNLYLDCFVSKIPANKLNRIMFDRQNMFRNHKNNGLSRLRVDPACVDDDFATNYLNKAEVRTALHIPDHLPEWSMCSDEVIAKYVRTYQTMKTQYEYLTQKVRGLIYNGDVDMACNFLGDEWFMNDLQLPVVEERRNWNVGKQISGFVRRFHNLDVLTIKGSGHMVPQDKPLQSFKMIQSFIFQKPY